MTIDAIFTPQDKELTDDKDNDLYQLIYISQSVYRGLVISVVLNRIRLTSFQNNAKHSSSGVLFYSNGYFFQYVEGSEKALTDLKNILLTDSRHHQLKILNFSQIPTRRFSQWQMQTLVLEKWVINDVKLKSILPFRPNEWRNNEWQDFLALLEAFYYTQRHKAEYKGLGSKVFSQRFQLSQPRVGRLIFNMSKDNRMFTVLQGIIIIWLIVMLLYLLML